MSDSHRKITGSGTILIASVVAATAGVVILLGLVPAIQGDTLKSACSAAFGNVVECGSQGKSIGIAIAGALVSGMLAFFVVRRVS